MHKKTVVPASSSRSPKAPFANTIRYPADLPVSQRLAEIKKLITEHQVVVIAGETGSGKTTQIPKICLELGRGVNGLIGHTQPRRLAARSVASRIAEELDVELGQEVGYQVRFSDQSTPQTYVKLMTDGILLAETQHDRLLKKYDTIIIDEAHERSLNIDFLLGYLKRLTIRRPELKIIITSATIDVEKFSRHFDKAPVLEVTGRTFPVEVLYRPPEASEEGEPDLAEQIESAYREILKLDKSRRPACHDILVFLSGEKEIRDVAEHFRKHKIPSLEVLPLYARLSNKEQNRIFAAHHGRRMILTTNVAETSLTVPGIAYVIDAGMARISRYSVRSKIQRLPIEAISKASASQRAGRCGRICPGVCSRLYSEEDFTGRPDYTDTEIRRTNLASVILQMLSLRLGNIDDFPFIDPPESIAVRDGFKLLEELGAVRNGSITKRGRDMARLPVDPRFARVIMEAGQLGCLHEALLIVSALSIQDPRERPMDKQQAADQSHQRFLDADSDFMAFPALWDFYEEYRQSLNQNKLRKFCQKNFLSYMRMREWREVHRQLRLLCRELKLAENAEPASYENIHQAMLSGFLSQIAFRLDDGDYLGARNRKYQIFPGSTLYRKKSRWLVAAELVETSRLYARLNAKVEPQWIERQGTHLLKKEYSEPHFEKRRGKVIAFEKVSLYGLVLVEKRRKEYAGIDGKVSREIFIRDGIVGRALRTQAHFYHHNSKLIERIEQLEEKVRRRDILIDEESIYQFYNDRLPDSVNDTGSLERWYFGLDKKQKKHLLLQQSDLMKQSEADLDLQQFPDQLSMPTMALNLGYNFSPGKEDDGVSIDVPLAGLNQIQEADLDWLVPGLLKEKCIALVKALPKSIRKNFVPVPDFVERILPYLEKEKGSLRYQLAQQLLRISSVKIPAQAWDDYRLPEHLKMNIRLLDEQGKVIDEGRDLISLREQHADAAQHSLRNIPQNTIEQTGLVDWSFDNLPASHDIDQGGVVIKAWPALVDEGDSVAITLLDSEFAAQQQTRAGLIKLFMLNSKQQVAYLKKNLLQDPANMIAMKMLGDRNKLLEHLIRASFALTLETEKSLPTTRAEYDLLFNTARARVIETAERLEGLLKKILTEYHALNKLLKKSFKGLNAYALNHDIQQQLGALVHQNFLLQTPVEYLQEYPRYLKAINMRLEKYPRQILKDQEFTRELESFMADYEQRKALQDKHGQKDEKVEQFRWMLEEYRVSLFAQNLGTKMPVSAKRLKTFWSS